MKKRLFSHSGLLMTIIAGAAAIGFSSCKKEPVTPPTQPALVISYNSEVVDDGKALDQVDIAGGSSIIYVESTRGWTITIPAADTWLTADTKSGSANKGTPAKITLTAAANGGSSRTSTVTIATTDGGLSQTVVFRQSGTVPVGDITISQIRAMYAGTADVTISDDKTLVATVISDASEAGGNATSLKNIVIQDGTAGIMIRLVDNPKVTYSVGDVVSVKVKDLVISNYSKMVQLNNVPESVITKTGDTNTIPAVSITPAELLTGNYESMYVAVSGVQFLSDAVGKKINDAVFTKDNTQGHSTVMIETQDGKLIASFVSKYAGFFATQTVPESSGVMKGIAGINFDEFQIQPRTAADYSGLTEARFAEAPRFGVSQEAVSVPASGGEATVSVTGNVEWTVAVTEGADNLVSDPTGNGTGAGEITLDFKENTDTANAKVVTITVGTAASVTPNSFNIVFTQARATAPGEEVAFVATWDMNGRAAWADVMAPTSVTGDTGIEVGSLTPTGFNQHATNNPAGSTWGGIKIQGNTEADPFMYATFTLEAPADHVFSLGVLNVNIRVSGTGAGSTVLQYKVGDGNYTTATTWEHSSTDTNGNNETFDFATIPALMDVAAGTVVTVRFIPLPKATTGDAGTWYINKAGLVVNGTVK